ncbi:hypothetical protein BKI52_29915 [marine bacterium AO1-C]|nr:hypothetical protein BKI52_29915 [marine bacterium AO1-C]
MLNPEYRLLSNTDYQAVKDLFLYHIFPEYGKKNKRGREGAFDRMLLMRRVDFEYSVGAFVNDKIIGFILMGVDSFEGKITACASGTGILTTYRRKGFASQMLQFLVTQFKLKHINQALVTAQPRYQDGNKGSAARIYENIGYTYNRLLVSYKVPSNGLKPPHTSVSNYRIHQTKQPNWSLYNSWQNTSTSWERAKEAILINTPYETFLEVQIYQQTVGFLVGDLRYGKITQINASPDHDRASILSALIYYFHQHSRLKRLRMFKIDTQEIHLIQVLEQLGFVKVNELEELKLSF